MIWVLSSLYLVGSHWNFLSWFLLISLTVLRVWVLMSDYLGLILAVPLPEVSSWENPSAFLSLGFSRLGNEDESSTCFVDLFCGLNYWINKAPTFLGGSDGRICLQCRRLRFDPWVGKITLEKEIATHSSILAWEIPLTKEPGGLQSMGWQKSDKLSN